MFLKKKVRRLLLLFVLSTTVLCLLWTAQQEWDYHINETPLAVGRQNRQLKEGVDSVIAQLLEGLRSYPSKNVASFSNTNMDDYNDMETAETALTSTSGNASLRPCPLNPSENLIGRLAGNKTIVEPDQLLTLHPFVEVGGRVRPKNCVGVEKVALVIPFRNRHTHLFILLNNLFPLLQRQLVDARVFLLEQAEPTIFNRAALFNVGFLEALKFDRYDCFIFHDVDLIPLDDRNLYRCEQHPVHFAAAMDKNGYKLPYTQYLGGVVGFTAQQYRTINGNSNLYFGWGGEDDDLYERVVSKDLEIGRPLLDTGKYDMIRHKQDDGNEDNCDRRLLLRTAKQRQDIEGLNSLKYKVLQIEMKPYVTWINVFLSMEDILATTPEDTRKDMNLKHSRTLGNACNFSREAPIHD